MNQRQESALAFKIILGGLLMGVAVVLVLIGLYRWGLL